MADDSPRYEAFISYRHAPADSEAAKRVQRVLEGFRIPRALRRDGRRSLGKLFRDSDELPASSSLTEEISRALRDSRFLIVICSPDTPSSTWVNLEIDQFLDMHGPDRILAVLIAGEPEKSFPAALLDQAERGHEPLAADFRPGKTSRELHREELRLAAALIGCGLDNLVNRRRVRAAKIAAAAACGAAVVGGVIGWQASQLRGAQTTQLIEQSEQLASKSGALLDRGLRMEAIQVAAAGLPQTEDASDRPLVPAALNALTDALGVYPTSSTDGMPESRARYSHEAPNRIDALTVSEDGTWFAMELGDGSMGVFDTLTGERLTAIEDQSGANPAAVEDTLILCQDGSCSGYDRQSAQLRWALPDDGRAYLRAISLGGSRALVTAFAQDGNPAQDGALSLLTIAVNTGDILSETAPLVTDYEGGYVKDLITSPDKSRAAAILDSQATIADLATGEHRLVEEDFRITSGVMSSQALYLTGYRADEEGARTFVCAYGLKTAQELWSFDRARSSEPTSYTEMPQLFLAGDLLYLSDDGSIRQLDISTGDVMNEGSSSEAVRFGFEHLDGAIAFEQLHQNGIGQFTYMFLSGSRAIRFKLAVPGGVYTADPVTLDGTHYELVRYDDDGSCRIGLFPAPPTLDDYPGATRLDEKSGVLTLPTRNDDGSVVAYCSSASGKIAICDFSDREASAFRQVDLEMSSLANIQFLFLPDVPDSLFACDLGAEGSPVTITKVNVRTGSLEGTWTSECKPASSSAHNLLKLVSAEEDSIIVTGGDGVFMEVVDGRTLKTVETVGTPMPLMSISPSDGGKTDLALVAWEACGEYLCYSTPHGFEQSRGSRFSEAEDNITDYDLANSANPYACLLVSPDESKLFVACSDSALRCFSTEDGGLLWEYAPGGPARPLSVSPDGAYLLAEYDMGRLSLIETATGNECAQMEESSGAAQYAEFSADGKTVSVALYDSEAPSTLQSIHLDRYDVSHLEFSKLCSIGQAICCVGSDSHAFVISNEARGFAAYTLPLYTRAELLDMAEEVTRGHELAAEERRLYGIE